MASLDSSNGDTRSRALMERIAGAAYICYLTSIASYLGIAFGISVLAICQEHPDARSLGDAGVFERMAAWDGVWYQRIAREGYTYSPAQMSSVAFYPLYPGIGGIVGKVTGLSPAASLVLVSQSFFIGTFILLAFYLAGREDGLGAEGVDWTLLALGLFPTTLYFRMAYSESCFLFFVVLAMCGMRWRWPLFWIALTIGAATATRSLGVAAILPFLWHMRRVSASPVSLAIRGCLYSPVCVWGIVAYMAYQHYAFGNAFAFTQTMAHWYERQPPSGVWNSVWAWGTLEAYRDVYDPGCQCYWANVAPRETPFFNLKFLNPIFALFAWGAVAWGWWKKWITIPESLLSLGLLGIPYFTHAYWACASSEARYASVVFPVYIVLGHALKAMPPALSGSLAALSGAALFAFTSLFVAWYWFY